MRPGPRRGGAGRRVALAALVFWCGCLALSLHRTHVFYATMDQGIFNQVFWNGLHGRPFESSLSSTVSYAVTRQREVPSVAYRRLGQHFTPTLALWLPLYALWPSPGFLVVLQVTLATAGGLLLHALARRRLAPALAALVAISYYAAHAVIGPTLSNFHDIIQLPVLLFGLFLVLESRHWGLFWLLVALVLGVREDAGVPLVGLGLYLLASRRHPRLGAALLVASVAYMLVVTGVVMPRLSPDVTGRFMVERFGQVLGGREATTVELVTTLLLRPWLLLRELVTPVVPTLQYVVDQWLPLAFVPVLSPAAWLLSGPGLAGVLVQGGKSPLSINIRYAMAIVPPLFYGAVLWWARHPAAIERRGVRRFWKGCIAVAAATSLTSNPHQVLSFLVPDSFRPWLYVPITRQWERARTIRRFVARVPPEAAVAASSRIVAPLSSRRAITRLPRWEIRGDSGDVRPVDYVIADVSGGRVCDSDFMDERAASRGLASRLEAAVRGGRYGLLGFADGVVLVGRGAPSDAAALDAWREFLARCHPAIAAGDHGGAPPR